MSHFSGAVAVVVDLWIFPGKRASPDLAPGSWQCKLHMARASILHTVQFKNDASRAICVCVAIDACAGESSYAFWTATRTVRLEQSAFACQHEWPCTHRAPYWCHFLTDTFAAWWIGAKGLWRLQSTQVPEWCWASGWGWQTQSVNKWMIPELLIRSLFAFSKSIPLYSVFISPKLTSCNRSLWAIVLG